MKRKLYEVFVPKSIRDKLYVANARQFNESEIARIWAVEASLPPTELSAVYIAKLKVLTDRQALLHALPKQAVVGEVGVHNGDFSDLILTITAPTAFHLIGAWPPENSLSRWQEHPRKVVKNKFRAEIQSGQLMVHDGEPLAELKKFSESFFDWIYLDAERSFEPMSQLLALCSQKVKANGIIAGRNYCPGSVPERERFGVIEAIHGFCKANGWELLYLTNERQRNLSYAIKKMV